MHNARESYLRAKRAKVTKDEPMAVYYDYNRRKYRLIDDMLLKNVLQEAAQEIYGIDSRTELQKFTAHSIRVGACVLLHSAGQDSLFIKFRLRWRSDSFMMYLRNTIDLAAKQREAIS